MKRSLLVLVSVAALHGCGAGAGPSPNVGNEGRSQTVTPVSDERFAQTVRELLMSEPRSETRRVLLAQTLSRQMVRARSYFESSAPDRGLATVLGALSLASAGELDVAALGPSGKVALTYAARELSARGDEGGAFAAYSLLVKLSPEAERKEHEAHLQAIARWLKDLSATSRPIDAVQMVKNAAIGRATVEPSEGALTEAAARTTEWLQRGLEIRANFRRNQVPPALRTRSPEQQDAFGAVAALKYAPITLAALYLRHGDAKGALAALERGRAQEIAPQLMAVLEPVANKPTAERWAELLRALRPEEGEELEPSMGGLLRMAQFRVAAEAFRLDPTILDSAGEVAVALMEFEMLEAAPAILVEAIKAHPDPRVASQGLALLMQSMMRAADGDAARRSYKSGAPLLDVADGLGGKTTPSTATVRALMGEIELREGRVPEARALLQRAAGVERTGPVAATLARIARSEGRADEALAHLKEALASPEATRSPALRGEILLMTSDILRERGQVEPARGALADALRGLAQARKAQDDAEGKARVERTLSKVLDRFGAAQKAKQALERAFDAAPRDKQEASATILTMASRALLQGDLAAAREGLRRGSAADLPSDDLVYLALWARLIERQKKSSSDAFIERTFASMKDDGRWTGRLAAFGLGKISAKDLANAAKTPAQKTEALFYTAMDQRIAGDQKGAQSTLEQVVQASGGIELMEVSVARDLLSGARATVSGPVPDVGLP